MIDIMTIFRSPAYILGPLCSLLDDWNWDELHGELRAALTIGNLVNICRRRKPTCL